MTMLQKIDIATKEIRGINLKFIISVISTIVLGIWYLAGRLNTIENKIDIARVEQIYQHRNDSLQNHSLEWRLSDLEKRLSTNIK